MKLQPHASFQLDKNQHRHLCENQKIACHILVCVQSASYNVFVAATGKCEFGIIACQYIFLQLHKIFHLRITMFLNLPDFFLRKVYTDDVCF